MKVTNETPIRSIDITLRGGKFDVSIYRVNGKVKIKKLSPKAACKLVNRLYWMARFNEDWVESSPNLGETSYGAYMERSFYQPRFNKV